MVIEYLNQNRKTGTAAVVLLALLAGGCSALSSKPVQVAGDILGAACTLDLLPFKEVEVKAKELGVSRGLLSQLLCQIPELLDVWNEAKRARTDPGRAVVDEAKKRGLL